MNPLPRQLPDGIQYGLVLGARTEDMLPHRAQRPSGAEHGKIVGLRGTGGEDDLCGARTDEARHLDPREFNAMGRGPAGRVGNGRRIGKPALLAQAFKHLRADPGINPASSRHCPGSEAPGSSRINLRGRCSAGHATPVLYRGENAAQDIQLVLIQLRTLQEAADAVHEVGAGFRAVLEIHFLKHFLQVRVQLLHLGRRRQWRIGILTPCSGTAGVIPGTENLIAHQLHGHGEIDRGVRGAGRNPQQHVTCIQVLILQTGTLGSEQQRHRCAPGLGHHAHGGLPHIQHAIVLVTIREVVAATKPQSAIASSSVFTMRASASTAPAPAARAVASGCGNSRGRTSTSWSKSMFIMARATAPILPGWEGSTSTMRMSVVGSVAIASVNLAVFPLRAGFRASLFAVQPLLNIAVRAARRAGEIIVRSLNQVHTLTITAKGRNDFVTEVDQSAEREIIASIRKSYPDHAFLAEEGGASGNSEVVWIIDPLDGTTNFLHSNPIFAVSIACQIRGRLEHAVVYDPMRLELFTASRGGGAHVDNHRLRVTAHRTLEGALVGTGFPYRENVKYLDEYLNMLKAVIMNTAGIRRPGAASLDLAYVAAGRLDAFWKLA